MELSWLITSLQKHAQQYPLEAEFCNRTISLLEKYGIVAFENQNWEGHITASMMIINPSRSKVLLMLHKKFKKWLQFGGHSDGDSDTLRTAIREFHEESWVQIEPDLTGDIFIVDVHSIPADAKWRPSHFHHDIMYLGVIDESTPFARQEEEVDDIRWFDIDWIGEFIEEDMVKRIEKIKNYQ